MNTGGALRERICQTLSGNAAVMDLLGGPNIFPESPRQARFPYVTLAETAACDWSTGGEKPNEHILTLHVWSRGGGQPHAKRIIGALNEALAEAAARPDSGGTMSLRHEFSDARRDLDGELVHGIIRYRALSGPGR